MRDNPEFLRFELILLTYYCGHYDYYYAPYTFVIVVQVYLLPSRCLHKDFHFFLELLLRYRSQRQLPQLFVEVLVDFEQLRGGHPLLAPSLENCASLYQFLLWCNHVVMESIQGFVHE